jgi:signal transduction histidine kinase
VAYRLVQESLTNVRKLASGAAARIELSYRPHELELEVTNAAGRAAGSVNGGGHGIFGMRERVRLFGGRFEAGERPQGGFRVHALLPLEEEEA